MDLSTPNILIMCYLLCKAIYRLKQSLWVWFRRLHDFLLSLGFKISVEDPSLFIMTPPHIMIITTFDDTEISRILHVLDNEFKVHDLSNLNYFLCIHVHKIKNDIFLNQQRYLVDLLHSSELDNLRPSTTPMDSNVDFSTEDELFDCPSEYRRNVGSLQYMLLTRLDMVFAISKLSRYMAQPKNVHWISLKKILCYLYGTQDHGILLHPVYWTH